ncbi:MAG: class I SAM-dependent methyltransferase [Rhodospirillaceae bacterium]|nr:class I SAM-dependent methyltransferase [Rhodospirillaceae bacterium]
MHFDRRSLFGAAAAVAAVAKSTIGSRSAEAKLPSNDVEPRGSTGRLERLPTLALEANDEFLTSFRFWVNTKLSKAAEERYVAITKEKGIDPKANMPVAEAAKIYAEDPVIATRNHAWLHAQLLMWKNLRREFHGNYDAYMAEMEVADKSGPGTLELNPDMVIPEYTKHEIHIQPGGYVGDPFAGHIYHYGTNNFYSGRNYQDDLHMKYASNVPLPKDGKVRRILDMGCGVGQLSVALKQRFPNAEVWGIDIGAPMVRYGHMRAVDMGTEVNFAQRLAEETKFPDNHFDIITSYILHHEVTAEASRKIIAEAHRLTRAGGVYYPIDFNTAGMRRTEGPYSELRGWMSHRWNHERWVREYDTVDFKTEFAKVGFEVSDGPKSGFAGDRPNILGTKRA